MADFPDWTNGIQIVGSDVTLNIDIVAQSIGNISIDLVAQSVGAIEIDITTQSIGNLTIDIEAQSVGVFLQPDWNTKEGDSIAWAITGINLGEGLNDNTTYEVPSGKTLYITQATCAVWGWSANDRDLNQMVELEVSANYMGGNGGCQLLTVTPLRFTEGVTVTFKLTNRANHHIDYHASFRGYVV